MFVNHKYSNVLGKPFPVAAVLLVLVGAPAARADEPSSRHVIPFRHDSEGKVVPPPKWALSVGGYGDLQFQYLAYGPDETRPGGALHDSRLVFDTARFALEMEAKTPFGLEMESELEVEHHGTGSAMEVDYDEFGEYEQETELGGEIHLEELYLRQVLGPVSLELGRFYVGVGLLSARYRPTEYLGVSRPEGEVSVIPAVWDEMGVEARFDIAPAHLVVTTQLVSGLDSTGFSSAHWIAGGHQQRFELVSATDLAGVLRIDAHPTRGVLFGVSGYVGGSSRNRPKPDLVESCTGGSPDRVAPCGYIPGTVALADVHFAFDLSPVTVQGVALWGHLGNAAAITDRNSRLSNDLNVPRTPVADQALFAWIELAYDLGPLFHLRDHHIEPFFRFDYYDTMLHVPAGVFDNPRFARSVYTAGVSYAYGDLVFVKLDFAHRDVGAFTGAAFRAEDAVQLGVGFTL